MATTSTTTVISQDSKGTGGYQHQILLLYYFDYNEADRKYTIYARERFYHQVTDDNWANSSPYNYLSIDDSIKCTTKNNLGSPSGKGTFDLCPTFKGSDWQNMGTYYYNDDGTASSHTIGVSCGYKSSWAGIKRTVTYHPVTAPSIGAKTYTITYNLNGGSGTFSNQTKTHNVNLSLRSGSPTKSHYTFDGWAGSDGLTYASGSTFSGNYNLTLTAKWNIESYWNDINAFQPDRSTQNGLKFDLVVKDSGGAVKKSYSQITNEPSKFTYPYGYTATISNINSNITGAHYTSNNITGSASASFSWAFEKANYAAELYSVWNTYPIKFNVNGGSGTFNDITKTYNSPVTISSVSPSRSGYDFLGWSTNQSATTGTYQPGSTISTDFTSVQGNPITLYAIWRVTKPSNLSINGTVISPFDINVSFSCTGLNITNYTVYYKKHSDSSYISKSFGTSTSGSLNNLQEETLYDIYFSATNAGGTTNSGVIQCTTLSDQAKIYINNGTEWGKGKTWIYNGQNWLKAKKVYIYDGSSWRIHTNN